MPRNYKQPNWRYIACHCFTRGCNGKLITVPWHRQHQEADAAHIQRRDRVRVLSRQQSQRALNVPVPSIDDLAQEDHEDVEHNADNEDDDDGDEDASDETERSAYVDGNPIFDFPNWEVPLNGVAGKTVGHSVYRFLDWATRHKANGVTAKGAWEFGHYMRTSEDGPTLPKYSQIEKMIKKHREETTIRIDCCINMCIAYWNPTHSALQTYATMNAHRSICPKCDEPRWIIDPRTNKKVARRFFFYLPFKYWLQDLFAKADLVPAMANDIDPQSYPDGHVRRSDGWRKKVIENENIYSDRRHKALSLAADGVPYFDENGSASGWPIVLIDETLPDGLSRKTEYAHMVALVPSSYKSISLEDPSNPRIVTIKRSVH